MHPTAVGSPLLPIIIVQLFILVTYLVPLDLQNSYSGGLLESIPSDDENLGPREGVA